MKAHVWKVGDLCWVYWIGRPARGEILSISDVGRHMVRLRLRSCDYEIALSPAFGLYRTRREALLGSAEKAVEAAASNVASIFERLRGARAHLAKEKKYLAELKARRS